MAITLDSPTPKRVIRPITPSEKDLLTTAGVQLASFDSLKEYQDVIEPLPRPSLDVRTRRLAARLGRKFGANPSKPVTHVGYQAVAEDGKVIGIAYWRKPGFAHKTVDLNKMTEEERDSWEGMNTRMYENLYQAFQKKMDQVLAEKNESGCWYLEILAIHPDHQGRRVGTQLIDHHLALIDDPSSTVASAPAWLESSEAGFKLYKSRGFSSVGEIIAEGWEGGFPGMFRPKPRECT